MSYTQLRDANWKLPYVGGWCLKYVQDAFGTDHPYASAIDAWNANFGGGNHPGEVPPSGKTVAVYFSLGNVPAGHVAISLDDGTVASSTQGGSHSEGFIHPNLQNLIDIYAKYNGGCTYLGWSEYVGSVQVVRPNQVVSQPSQGGEDMIDQPTLNQLFQVILGRASDDGAVSHYVGHYSTSFVVNDLLASSEHAQHIANEAASSANLQAQVNDLSQKLSSAQSDGALLSTQVSQLTTVAKSVTVLQAELKAANDQFTALKSVPVTAPSVPTPQVSHVTGWAAFIKYIIDLFKVKGAK
jgi:hypothetical protein